MSPEMKREGTIVKQALAMVVALVLLSMAGSLWLLWARQDVERTAQSSRQLESEILKEERRVRYLNTKIAEIHQPAYLQRQNLLLGLNLRPPASGQIVYLQSKGERKYYAQRPETEGTDKKRDPFRHSFDLAVMEAVRPID